MPCIRWNPSGKPAEQIRQRCCDCVAHLSAGLSLQYVVICYTITTPPGSHTGCRMSRIRIPSGLQNFFIHSIRASTSCASGGAGGRRCLSLSGSSAGPRSSGRRSAGETASPPRWGTCFSASRGIVTCTTGSPILKGSAEKITKIWKLVTKMLLLWC